MRSLMRCGTILAAMAQAGVKTAAVTAKDKLRLMLARGLEGINFSSEHADRATEAGNGIGNVEAHGRSRQARPVLGGSLALCAGCRSAACWSAKAATLLYLSLSDFIQHAHAPGTPEANAFNTAVDDRIAAMMAAGAVVGVVADHGMNDKSRADGEPNVVFLQEELNRRFGDGAVRVICPITDPFVRHHGALGSFVRVYARKATDLAALMAASRALPGVEAVLDGPAAAAASSCRSIWKAISSCWAMPARSSAPPAPSTTSQASPAIACARTGASASRRCRSWSRTSCARTTSRPRPRKRLAQLRHLRCRPQRGIGVVDTVRRVLGAASIMAHQSRLTHDPATVTAC